MLAGLAHSAEGRFPSATASMKSLHLGGQHENHMPMLSWDIPYDSSTACREGARLPTEMRRSESNDLRAPDAALLRARGSQDDFRVDLCGAGEEVLEEDSDEEVKLPCLRDGRVLAPRRRRKVAPSDGVEGALLLLL